MSMINPVELATWGGRVGSSEQENATDALERGHVLFLPNLRFELSDAERAFLTPTIVGKSKNVSFDPRNGKLGGANVAEIRLEELRG